MRGLFHHFHHHAFHIRRYKCRTFLGGRRPEKAQKARRPQDAECKKFGCRVRECPTDARKSGQTETKSVPNTGS